MLPLLSFMTYTSMGCPGTCSNFVKAYPAAFAEAYWSINSLRVYAASGKPVSTSNLSGGASAGIVIGCVAALVVIAFGWWKYTIWERKRNLKKGRVSMISVAISTSKEHLPIRTKSWHRVNRVLGLRSLLPARRCIVSSREKRQCRCTGVP